MGERRTMMNAMKRYISVMLVAALAVAAIQIPAFAANDSVKKFTKTITVGDTVELAAPAEAVVSNDVPSSETPTKAEPVKWTVTEGTDCVTLVKDCYVRGVKAGTAKVTAEGAETWVYTIEVTEDATPTTTPGQPTATPSQPADPTATPTPSVPANTTTPTAKPGLTIKPGLTVTAAPTTGGVTAVPTGEATVAPTGEATVSPTGEATVSPTGEATVSPTGAVTGAPTGAVTTAPTPTGEATPTPGEGTGTPTPTTTATTTPVVTATKAPTKAPEVKSVKLNTTKVTLAKKATVQLVATVTMKDKKAKAPKVAWASSKTSVATVKNGKVTAKAAGKTTITAKAGTKTAKCTVTVSSKDTVKVTYDLNGGKNAATNPQKYVYEGQKLAFAAPTKKGYAFEGWYVKGKLVKKTYTVPKNISKVTVTAKWSKVTSAATKSLKATAGKAQIKVSYAKVKGVKGYAITYKIGKKSKTVYTTKTSYTIKKLAKGSYKVSVKTYKLDSAGNKVLSKKAVSKTVKVTK